MFGVEELCGIGHQPSTDKTAAPSFQRYGAGAKAPSSHNEGERGEGGQGEEVHWEKGDPRYSKLLPSENQYLLPVAPFTLSLCRFKHPIQQLRLRHNRNPCSYIHADATALQCWDAAYRVSVAPWRNSPNAQ